MVARELKSRPARSRSASDRTMWLSVSHLSTKKLRDVSFDVRRGEVLGVPGLVGAGRSELGAALFGLDRRTGGEIRLNGKPVEPRSAREAIRIGIGLLPEDRKLQGLMMQMSVVENSTLAVLGRMQSFGFVDRGRETGAPCSRSTASWR